MRNCLKLGLVCAGLLFGASRYIERMTSLGASLPLIFYIGLLALSLIGLCCAAFVVKAPVRWGFAAIFAVGTAMVASFENSMSAHLSYDAFINMVVSAGSFLDAIAQYGESMAWAWFQAMFVFVGIGLRPNGKAALNGARYVVAPFLILLAFSSMLYARGGDGAKGLPGAYIVGSYGLLFGYELAAETRKKRENVRLPVSKARTDGDIIFIVDESISGQYLDINDPAGVYSGLARKEDKIAIHNFGLAASITHCSAGTNVTLRHGGTRKDYNRINKTMPSIWSYAKNAGYQTIYIDAQRTDGVYDNFMDEDERRDIGNWIQFDDVPVQQRDQAAAEKLNEYMNDSTRQFIYVNKMGAHFPIHDKYPDDYIRYEPILMRGSFLKVADTGDREGIDGSAENWMLYRNSYRNTLIWNVGAFFDTILAKAELSGATIIYTSDHGQTLHERGNPGLTTHCTPEPLMEEGTVPLVVISDKENGGTAWGKAAAENHNRMSHYRIFPTVLKLMGYNADNVKATYGHDLTSKEADPFTFNTLFNARLGRKPIWKQIDIGSIPRPSVDDYKSLKSHGEEAGVIKK